MPIPRRGNFRKEVWIMGEKTCCVTGHRDVPVGKEQYVEEALRKEVLAAIAAGYTRFISGFADGVDLTFAAIVAAEKKQNSCLQLEAALPYRNRINAKSPLFQELLACCDRVYVQSEKSNRDDRFDRCGAVLERHVERDVRRRPVRAAHRRKRGVDA